MIKLNSVPKPFPHFVTQCRCIDNKYPIMVSEPYNSDIEPVTDRASCNFESILYPAMRWLVDIPEALAKQFLPAGILPVCSVTCVDDPANRFWFHFSAKLRADASSVLSSKSIQLQRNIHEVLSYHTPGMNLQNTRFC